MSHPICPAARRRALALSIGLGLVSLFHAEPARCADPNPRHKRAKNQVTEQWQVIHLGKDRIGYSRSTETKRRVEGRTLVMTENEMRMTVKRFSQELKMTTLLSTTETVRGDLLSFTFEMKNPPAGSLTMTGTVDESRTDPGTRMLLLETTTAGRKREQRIPLRAGVKSPAYVDRFVRNRPLTPGEVRTLDTFLPELGKTSTVRLTASGMASVKLLDGERVDLLKVRIEQSALPTMPVVAYLDETGKTLRTDTPFLTSAMSTYTVSKEEALKAIAGAELDIAVNSLIHLKKPLRRGHRTSKAVYRISTPGDDPANYLVADEGQKIEPVDDETVLLTVKTLPMPGGYKKVAIDPEYLENSQYLQADDFRVQQHAKRATGGELNPARAAVRLERYVSEKLTQKNFSTALASAAEVAQNLEGDCTEHAVLLAAMLRASKIPSRVAVGLVYIESRSSFGGHMWTEAWIDGQWIPLDATLGRGGIGAAHIKLAQSSFSDEGAAPVTAFLPLLRVLGSMQIEVVSAE
jgi:hypothetical protein